MLMTSAHAGPVWQQRRFWYSPAPHRFAQRAAYSGGSTVMETDLSAPTLAYLWDHQVMSIF
jgi:hypothetical protein